MNLLLFIRIKTERQEVYLYTLFYVSFEACTTKMSFNVHTVPLRPGLDDKYIKRTPDHYNFDTAFK